MSTTDHGSGVEGFDALHQPDPALADALAQLDPAVRDSGYWWRFRAAVLERAGAELARRRLVAEPTVPDVMTSWARTVLPTALLAAAAAGLLLLRVPAATPPAPLLVEDLLVAELGDVPIPAALGSDETALVFAGERF